MAAISLQADVKLRIKYETSDCVIAHFVPFPPIFIFFFESKAQLAYSFELQL